MSTPSTARQGHVAALQWGLGQAALVALATDLLAGYYDLTTNVFFTPGWLFSVQAAPIIAFFVGAYGGYTWVTGGYAETTHGAHRTRLRFVVALVVLWFGHHAPELLVTLVVGSRLALALVPPLFVALVLVGAYLLAYRVDPSVFGRVQERLAPTGRRVESE